MGNGPAGETGVTFLQSPAFANTIQFDANKLSLLGGENHEKDICYITDIDHLGSSWLRPESHDFGRGSGGSD
jgi:hypothetical protein